MVVVVISVYLIPCGFCLKISGAILRFSCIKPFFLPLTVDQKNHFLFFVVVVVLCVFLVGFVWGLCFGFFVLWGWVWLWISPTLACLAFLFWFWVEILSLFGWAGRIFLSQPCCFGLVGLGRHVKEELIYNFNDR